VQVAGEDTVLYTVRRYLGRISNNLAQQQHASQVLASVIRCQHLSLFWLTSTVVSTQPTLPLSVLRPQLGQLLLLRSAQAGVVVGQSHLQELLGGAPASWALKPRASRPVTSVSVTWDVHMDRLLEAAQHCIAENATQILNSLESFTCTPPLGGMTFALTVQCTPHDAGCKVGIFARCANLHAYPMKPSFRFQLVSGGQSRYALCPAGQGGLGWPDFFKLGTMAGGWDEAALATAGLPSSGHLPISLTVSEVGHVDRVQAPVQARVGRRR
jgi:hypothetical protein